MKQVFNIIFGVIVILLLANCSGVPSPLIGDQNSSTIMNINTESQQVYIGHVAAIPVLNGSFSQEYAIVTNNSSSNLQLISSTVESAQGLITNPDLFIDAGQCSSLPSHASCAILIKGNSSLKSFIVNLSFSDTASGKIYQASQLINYINIANKNISGFYIDNSHIKVVLPRKYTTIVIPYILAGNYNNLQVSTGTTNAVAYTVCAGGNNYQANTPCTTLIKIKANGGTYNFNLLISGSGSNGNSIVSIPVTVTSNQVANLVTPPVVDLSESNLSVNAIIFNDGANNATGPGNKGVISASAYVNNININGLTKCSVIDPGASCTVDITVPPQKNDLLITLQLNYNNSMQDMVTTFLLNYIANMQNDTAPNLSITMSGQNAFNYVTLDPTVPYGPIVVTVTNTGNATLNSLSISDLTIQDSAIQLVNSANGCQNGQTLPPNQTCILSYTYNPQNVEAKILNLTLSGSYTNLSGQSISYNTYPVSILVNAVSGLANLVTTFVPDSLTITADGESSAEFQVITTNTGLLPATNIQFGYTLPNMVQITINDCENLTTLAPGESCATTYKFGPTTSAMAESYVIESVSYYAAPSGPNQQIAVTTGNDNKILLTAISGAKIIVENVVPLSGAFAGSGVESDPWQFYNSGTKALQLEVTYKNIGVESAESFNATVSNLPIGVIVDDSSTCGNGGGNLNGFTNTLAPNTSCTIVLDEVANAGSSHNLSWNYQNFNGPINTPIPEISYWDSSSGVHRLNLSWNSANTLYTYAQSLIALNFTIGTVTINVNTAQYIYPVMVTNKGPAALTNLTFVVSGDQNTSISGTIQTQNGCAQSIASGESCQINFASQVGMTQLGYSYSFSFYYSVAGYATTFTGYTNLIIPEISLR